MIGLVDNLRQYELPEITMPGMPDMEYTTGMGMAFRVITLPLLLPTPMGPLAFMQTLLAVGWMSTLAYDVYLQADEIEAFIDEVNAKKRAKDRWSPFEWFD